MDSHTTIDLPPIYATWLDPATWFVRRGSLDYLSPLLAYHGIRQRYRPAFLLESAAGPEKIARYSILAFDPLTHVAGLFGVGDSWDRFVQGAEWCFQTRADTPTDGPPFIGWYGYVNYELPQLYEPVTFRHERQLDIPDFYFMLPGQILVFDHRDRSVTQLYHASKHPVDLVTLVEAAPARFWLPYPADVRVAEEVLRGENRDFQAAVQAAREHIRAGDIFQVVLSQRFEVPFPGDPLDLYRVLRTLNPSPYMFFLAFNGTTLLGSSPEMLVRQRGDTAWVRPIAGTRRRGATEEEDEALIRELQADEKERAEHVMLVDLARNDLGRIAEPGQVDVVQLMTVERYSHVLHLTSEVRARVRSDASPLDVLAAAFPAGTVTGAPKIRAMEIIEELEPLRRQFYAGGVGYIGMQRQLDFCITIRSALVQKERLVVQAGAGVVWDSEAAREDQECRHKAMALLQAARILEAGS